MNSKYNWDDLKKKYILGDYKSLLEFANSENMEYQTVKNRARGWNEEKVRRNRELSTKTLDKVFNKRLAQEVSLNIKHLEVWDKLLNRVAELANKDKLVLGIDDNGNLIYEDINPKMVAELTASMDKIQKGQRLSEGMSTAIELARLKLEREKLELYKKKMGDDKESIEESNKQITLLADLINNPQPGRNVQEFEEADLE